MCKSINRWRMRTICQSDPSNFGCFANDVKLWNKRNPEYQFRTGRLKFSSSREILFFSQAFFFGAARRHRREEGGMIAPIYCTT